MQINPAEVQWDDTAPQAAPQTPSAAPVAAPTPSDIQWDDAPTNDTKPDQPVAQQTTDLPGFTDEQKQAILDYIPEAKDAADLERYSSELTQGHARIGNAQDVLDKYAQGHRGFGWEKPTLAKGAAQPTATDVRSKIGDTLVGALDTLFPGIQAFIKSHQGAGKAFTEHAANSAAGDYGPEVAGALETAVDPSQWSDFGKNVDRNVAHERAQIEGDSQGHGVASALGEMAGMGLVAPVAGEAVADTPLADIPAIAKAAAGGAVVGSGAGGPDHRLAGAVTGAALGGATEAAAPYVIKYAPVVASAVANAAKRAAPASPEAIAAAQGANDLGITLPKYALNDESRAQAGALEQTPFGRGPIRDARGQMIETSEAARNQIASSVGNAADDTAMGDATRDAAVSGVKANRAAIGKVYDQAKVAAGGNMPFWAQQTGQTLDNLIAEENQSLGNSKVAGVFQDLKDNLQQKGNVLTIDGARLTRTNLRSKLINDAGVTPDNATRLTNQVMDSIGTDINNGLKAAGRSDAIPLYQQADKQWAQQLQTEDDVLKPILGKNMDEWGENVAKRINSDVKGNGTRLAQFLNALPDDQANNVRASIIARLGTAKNGAQNAAGDNFSLSTFLTNWNEIKGARNLIFSPETRNALNKLADVANVGKLSESERNNSRTGGVISRLLLGGETTGSFVGFMTGHPHEAIAGALLSSLTALRQYGAAKLLANPDFARKLAATPMNVAGASAFWSRPWVNAMAAKNPAIAGEIQLFQSAVNDNFRHFKLSANSNANEKGKNQ